MNNIYDNRQFFDQYSKMSRSQQGLSGAGEWHQLLGKQGLNLLSYLLCRKRITW